MAPNLRPQLNMCPPCWEKIIPLQRPDRQTARRQAGPQLLVYQTQRGSCISIMCYQVKEFMKRLYVTFIRSQSSPGYYKFFFLLTRHKFSTINHIRDNHHKSINSLYVYHNNIENLTPSTNSQPSHKMENQSICNYFPTLGAAPPATALTMQASTQASKQASK